MILAMVASLCAVAVVAPASANVTGPGADALPDVTVTNDKAGQTSGYSVTLISTSALATTDEIILTFPSGTNLPSTFAYQNVLVGTPGMTAAVNVGSNGVNVVDQTVSVKCPVAIAAGGTVTVTITQGEGIVNPALSREPAAGTEPNTGGYTVAVSTTQETTPVASTEFYIYNWISVSPPAAAMGDNVTVTGGGFMPEQDVNLADTGAVIGSGTVGAD
jgi:hypothetical protein